MLSSQMSVAAPLRSCTACTQCRAYARRAIERDARPVHTSTMRSGLICMTTMFPNPTAEPRVLQLVHRADSHNQLPFVSATTAPSDDALLPTGLFWKPEPFLLNCRSSSGLLEFPQKYCSSPPSKKKHASRHSSHAEQFVPFRALELRRGHITDFNHGTMKT